MTPFRTRTNETRRRAAPGFARSHLSAGIAAAVLAIGAIGAAGPALAEDPELTSTTNITGSGGGGAGIAQINQDAGADNNQANATVIARSHGDGMAALAGIYGAEFNQAAGAQLLPSLQNNHIEGSFNDYTGIAQVNQATGAGNEEVNAVAMAFAPGAAFSSTALTDIELGLVAAPPENGPGSALPDSHNETNNSFNGFNGIAQVSQVAGDSNVITHVVAIAMATGL
jgi:hypothetical protein